jgi:hypothetical protein
MGPGYAAVDLAVHKTFLIEGKTIDFGLEGFNVLNRANYLRPPTDYYRLINNTAGLPRLEGPLPSYGKPDNSTRSRELQAVLRLTF